MKHQNLLKSMLRTFFEGTNVLISFMKWAPGPGQRVANFVPYA